MKLLKSQWGLLLVFFLCLIPLYPLLHSGLPITHDGQDHVARIANFYQSLMEGVIVPRWAGNLNWGYGHPILMFLYPASSYSTSLIHLLGFGLVDSVKITFGLSFILSGVFMYLWLREYLSNEAAVVGAILYNFAPYRFVDLYVRGAIGEHVAFVFLPLVLFFLLKISRSENFNRFYFSFASISIAGLLLAHNAISIMFLPFILIYAIYLVYINKKRLKELLAQYIGVLALGFGLSSFFLVPAFIEGKYTLRDIVTGSDALKRFIDFKDIIYSPWGYGVSGNFSVQLGIFQWISVLAFPFVLYFLHKKKNKDWIFYLITFVYFLGSIFIMLPLSDFVWRIITTLQKFQFPWRFLSISVFTSAVLGAYLIFILPQRFVKPVVIIFILLTLGISYTYWQPKGYLEEPTSFYTGIYKGTTDTGESAPIWSVRFMEKQAKAPIEVIKGKANIKQISKSSTNHVYIITSDEKVQLKENTLYFPGWRIYVDGVQDSNVQFQDTNNRGLMTFYVPEGKHNVEIKFGDTRLRTLSNYLSLASLIILFGVIFSTFKVSKK